MNLHSFQTPNLYTVFMQDARDIKVTALWDDEAAVWVATSDQVPGLVTEAETLEVLLDELRLLIPELLELNGGTAIGDLPVSLTMKRTMLVTA